ncbi:MAG: AAA family ATPase [Acidiferrobacterales bacterium]|nr:AAA family ATPase [Acidiferrobacterales bacterium]
MNNKQRPNNQKELPLGIQSFRTIREGSGYYVDKTTFIDQLTRGLTRHYFLSRPRRFGKSLLLDTMLELFEGNEQLFKGLHIHDHWDWKIRYPVVRLSFGGNRYRKPGTLEENVRLQLTRLETKHALPHAHNFEELNDPDRFGNLLYHIHVATGKQVVVLVDEYDKPILDAIENPELAISNRDYLQGLYAVIKDFGAEIRFAFITGITMFSKVSLFSTLNNLTDISLDPRYSSICGYTESDLNEVFSNRMIGLDLDQVRHWYNGYSWLGEERVYNPWAILNLLELRKFEAYWSITGMPSFLYKVMMEREFTPLDVNNLKVERNFISTFDVDDMGAEALMFQSGYLTITGEQRKGIKTVYDLDYPNLEVRASLNDGYLQYLSGQGKRLPVQTEQVAEMLRQEDFEGFEVKIQTLFAAIPNEVHRHNSMAHYEGWYCSVLHACLWDSAARPDIHVQESTSRGRSDLVLVIDRQIFIFECKMLSEGDDGNQRVSEAIAQIKSRGYADKYRDGVNRIYFIGAVFDGDKRNLIKMEVESG